MLDGGMHRPLAAIGSLSPMQRVLLATDGTVTHVLEAYAGEPIEVVKLHQAFDRGTDADSALDVSDADRVLRRRVLLRGRHSHRDLVYAEAVVAVDRVDAALVAGLVDTDKPIGMLLAEGRIETFREILAVTRTAAGSRAADLSIPAEAEVVSRTYRIIAGRRPIALIAETFPVTSFRTMPE
jgi:chorismate-pyruvate lyase